MTTPFVRVHGNPETLHDSGASITAVTLAPLEPAEGAAAAANDNWERPDYVFMLFDFQERLVASARSGKALSKFAFAKGAWVVRHDYDLGVDVAA